jgi:peptidylprolyl isomerase
MKTMKKIIASLFLTITLTACCGDDAVKKPISSLLSKQ